MFNEIYGSRHRDIEKIRKAESRVAYKPSTGINNRTIYMIKNYTPEQLEAYTKSFFDNSNDRGFSEKTWSIIKSCTAEELNISENTMNIVRSLDVKQLNYILDNFDMDETVREYMTKSNITTKEILDIYRKISKIEKW